MGSAHSTSGKNLSNEPGKDGDVKTISTTVPNIPGWNGIPIAIMPVHVSFEMKMSLRKLTASMDPLNNAIMAQNTAGEGYSIAAVFLPVVTQGEQKGEPVEAERTGWRDVTAKCMCIFQKNTHTPIAPLETLLLQSTMKQKYRPYTENALQVEGYEGLYSQLTEAGNKGFSLSAIIDEPNVKFTGMYSKETSVHLICQKNQGVQNPPSQYIIINCPIKFSSHFRSFSASMPDLVKFLTSYCTQGHKIASIYNPPTVSATGLTSGETQCHIILSKTQENYYFTVQDVPFIVKLQGMIALKKSRSVDHSQYLSVIQAYASQGWELAGLIDMPDASAESFSTRSSTIKLIFQAPASNGQPGGAL